MYKMVRVGKTLTRAAHHFARDDGAALSGYMAYTALLCLFPFLIFATALSGLLIGTDGLTPVIEFLFEAVPDHVAKTIQPVIVEVVANRSGKILGFSAFGAIWIASNGFEALRVGLERAYQTHAPRPWWKNRLISITFVFCAVVAFFLLAVLIVFGPSLAALAKEFTGISQGKVDLWHYFRYGAGAFILAVFLVMCHVYLPGKRPRVPLFRGVFFTIVFWMLLASAFSIYFRYAPSYAITYGALGGVIATLLFFYVSSAIFLFGAQINSAAGAPDTNNGVNDDEGDEVDDAPLF